MKIAVSIGDLNGIGLEIALSAHNRIKKFCKPIYCINEKMLRKGAKLLNMRVPKDFLIENCGKEFEISPGEVSAKSGKYSYDSFKKALKLAKNKEVSAVLTLPVNKKSWAKAGICYKGHTDALKKIFKAKPIMMIGCEKLFVALYTHHIPFKEVPKKIKTKDLTKFLITLYKEIKEEPIGVLGLNPHASDNGIMGNEEKIIKKAIKNANKALEEEIFKGPLVPDTAFISTQREKITYFATMYHDQGLIPVKTLYFDEGVNVSLNLPIIRTSVDHGTAFDIAYKKKKPSTKSYINAAKEAKKLIEKKGKYII